MTVYMLAILGGMILLVVTRVLLARRGNALAGPDPSWQILAQRYRLEEPPEGRMVEDMGAKVGRNYGAVGCDGKGLLLANPSYPKVRIPWGDVSLRYGTFMDVPAMSVEARNAPEVTILVPRRLEDALKAASEGNWPGEAS